MRTLHTSRGPASELAAMWKADPKSKRRLIHIDNVRLTQPRPVEHVVAEVNVHDQPDVVVTIWGDTQMLELHTNPDTAVAWITEGD